ncbi:DUF4345 family protein [Nocardia callitridis]|uniref:DUF4345 domain-containing protein n=1 Tax=Nocardia callitridis TaxID=648753 RepID=A0ABP9JSF6_9NOCA
MRDWVVGLAGVFFFGMGVFALVAPSALVRPFDLEVPTARGRSEVRAVYGGFGVAVAGMLWWAVFGAGEFGAGIVFAVGVALGGMAFGRVVSRAFDAATSFYPIWFYFLVEAAGAALLIGVA